MLFFIILFSFILGIILTLTIQWFLFYNYFIKLPEINPSYQPQFSQFKLPKEILQLLDSPDLTQTKESANAVNLIFQFLFRELKDTKRVRRWVMKKMSMEFEEMLHRTITGRLLEQIMVRDFNLGTQFPVVKNVTISKVELHEQHNHIEKLDLIVDLDYTGGFQLAVDVDTVLARSAFLSVKVIRLKGQAILRFTRQPYTYWSFSFLEEPLMEFDVESHFQGRPMPQITSLIINQIRRTVRKKHTLPNYKIRYKPFFTKVDSDTDLKDIHIQGRKITEGHLEVTVIECSRLVKINPDAKISCSLILDSSPCMDPMGSSSRMWNSHDLEIIRQVPAQHLGIVFKQEYILDKNDVHVVVETVASKSPAALADVKKNDLLMSVAGIKITSVQQAANLLKRAGDRFHIRIERRVPSKFVNKDDGVPPILKTPSQESLLKIGKADEAINKQDDDTSVSSADTSEIQDDKPSDRDSPVPSASEVVVRRRGLTFLSSSKGLFNKQPSSSNITGSPTAAGSKSRTESPTRIDSAKSMLKVPDNERPILRRNRSKSDTAETIKERLANADIFGTSNINENESFSYMSKNFIDRGLSNMEVIDLKQTRFVRASQDPVWHERFVFEVKEHHRYLNIYVWYKNPDKMDKQDKVIRQESPIVLGIVNIPLMDIVLECMTVTQQDYQQTFTLKPPFIKSGASRSHKLSSHPGFDENMCYGDITLAFVHKPLSRDHSQIKEKNIQNLEDDIDEIDKLSPEDSLTASDEKKHNFALTQFHSATSCHFCGKKIWLKIAFQCLKCNMICHKKCVVKCQNQTVCSREGSNSHQPCVIQTRYSKDIKNFLFGRNPEIIMTQASDIEIGELAMPRSLPPSPRESPRPSPGSTPTPTPPGSPRTSRKLLPNIISQKLSTLQAEISVSRKSSGLIPPEIDDNFGSSSTSSPYPSPVISRKSSLTSENPFRSTITSEPDEDVDVALGRLLKLLQTGPHDELLVSAAKEFGKELYSHLSYHERKRKLNAMIAKLQTEIDAETNNRGLLTRAERETTDSIMKTKIAMNISKSDEKIQALAVLMLHYCAGLQYCIDNEQEDSDKECKSPSESALLFTDKDSTEES